MTLRHHLVTVFTLAALFVASLCSLHVQKRVRVVERSIPGSSEKIVIASWPVELGDFFFTERPPGSLYAELITMEPGPWPSAALGSVPGGQATFGARVAELGLALSLRMDFALGTNRFLRWAMSAVPGRAVLLAPQIHFAGESRAFTSRGDLLPGVFFSAFVPGPPASEFSVSPPGPANGLAAILDQRSPVPARPSGPWVFHSQYFDGEHYPALMASGGELARGVIDGSRILVHYRVPGAQMAAYCVRRDFGNVCGNDPAAFTPGDRAIFAAWESVVPPGEGALAETRAIELLLRCERSSLLPADSAELARLLFGNRALASSRDSALPFLVRRCGEGVGDTKLADYGKFLQRVFLVKRFQYVNATTLATGILGTPTSLKEETAPGEALNWYSDYTRLFSEGFSTWAGRSAATVPGLGVITAPTPRSVAVLLALLSIESAHFHDAYSRQFTEAVLGSGQLTPVEVEWIRKNLEKA